MGNVASNFAFSDVCFSFMRRAFIRDRRSKSPGNASAVKLDVAKTKEIPIPKIFFQFQPLQVSSSAR